jgi:hypothetical protein
MERIKLRTRSLLTQMVAQISRQACLLMRPKVRAYSHQGHGPRADQTGRVYISDFRYPENSFLHSVAGPYSWVRLRLNHALLYGLAISG